MGDELNDETRWRVERVPDSSVLLVTFPRVVSFASIRAYEQTLFSRFEAAPHAMVNDLRQMSSRPPGPVMRRAFYESMRKVLNAYGHRLIAEAVVSPSRILRGLYTAYQWSMPAYPCPAKSFEGVDEALHWAKSHGPKPR